MHAGDPAAADLTRAGFVPRAERLVALSVLTVALAIGLPLFLCMPPWVDNAFFDVCARSILRGDVVYREVFLHGPPGMVLVQSLIRWACGWRSEVLRAVDLVLVGTACWLLAHVSRAGGLVCVRWRLAILALFYLSTSEWCHCQPDLWMMAPGITAMTLRMRQVERMVQPDPRLSSLAPGACLEGILWAMAFLLKPFIVLPACACWLAGTLEVIRSGGAGWRALAIDLAGLIAGGSFIGGLTIAWLWLSGNWPYLLEAMHGTWNAEYYQFSNNWAERTQNMFCQMWPGGFVHVVALPIALYHLIPRRSASPAMRRLMMLSAMYLGWLVQANYLQKQYDYHLAPAILLGLTVIASDSLRCRLLAGIVGIVIAWSIHAHPIQEGKRLALWPECWRHGSTPRLRNELALAAKPAPDWLELEETANFLRSQHTGDHELICYGLSSVHLFNQLGVQPASRFVLIWPALNFFQGHRDDITRDVLGSPQRYIVHDLAQDERLRAFSFASDQGLPEIPAFLRPYYPWSEKLVFRAGRYLVFQSRPGGPRPQGVKGLYFW